LEESIINPNPVIAVLVTPGPTPIFPIIDVVPVVEIPVLDNMAKLLAVPRFTAVAGVNVLANPATEVACVTCASAKTVTVLSAPPAKPVRPVIVTTVLLVLVNVPADKGVASVPTKVKSVFVIGAALNVPPVKVIVTVLFAVVVVNTAEVTSVLAKAFEEPHTAITMNTKIKIPRPKNFL
jgi:hypothetical protein